jgi:CubicO group peptidase (beta-lactamase class C family)
MQIPQRHQPAAVSGNFYRHLKFNSLKQQMIILRNFLSQNFMKKSIFILCVLLISNIGFCQTQVELEHKIHTYLKGVQSANQIPGLAVAVIKNGKVIYEGYLGKSSLEANLPVNKNTLFGIFSTTKLISTVGVFQLIEKNKLNLNDNISKYIDSLPAEWGAVKIKNLLTHSSGLPDVVRYEDIPHTLTDSERLKKLLQKPIQFEIGNQFRYNQTNYWLLTLIIEKITGNTFDNFILENQFSTGKANVIFSSDRNELIENRATKYDYDSKVGIYKKNIVNNGVRAHSGNGLNITLAEMIQWNESLDKNILLKKETKAIMWSPFDFKNKKDNFLHGWGQYKVNNKVSYGFSGGNVSAFRKFVENDMTIVFLSNGYKYFDVQDVVINHIAGLVDQSLLDTYLIAEEQLTTDFLNLPFKKAVKRYFASKMNNPEWNFESRFNSIGYALLRNKRVKTAIQVFELNTKENPKSGDAFDSLGEGYFELGKYKISKQHYLKSLELTPQNDNAKEMIQKIDKLLNIK